VLLGAIVGVSVAVDFSVTTGVGVIATSVKDTLVGAVVVTSTFEVGIPGAQEVKRKATITMSKMFVFIELLSWKVG